MTTVQIIETIPYAALIGWCIYSSFYVFRANRNPETINKYTFELIPQIFTTIGILGTFIGIAVGLYFFDVANMEKSIPTLLNGLKTAFIASIFGIVLYMVFSKITAFIQHRVEKNEISPEVATLRQVHQSILDLGEKMEILFTSSDGQNIIKPGNVLRDLYQESQKQSEALQTFSTDLANKIEAGFDTILTTQIANGVIPELQNLRREIEALGGKINDPSTEMTQNVVKDLEAAMDKMINEFKTSVSGSTKTEMENLAKILGQAGGSLTSFPEKLQEMTNNLNSNFHQLQVVVQQISQNTLEQSSESTKAMKLQVEEMSEILKARVGELQIGQETLINKQTENITVSDRLLESFNNSIGKMKGLSESVNDTIARFDKVQLALNRAAAELNVASNNANSSTQTFKNIHQQYAEQNNQFLTTNKRTIEEIQSALTKAKDVSSEYANKFSIIEAGLQSIFGQIQEGLDEYSSSINSSLESYLGKYSEALTNTAQSLASASSKHEEILEELTEQLSSFNGRKN